MSAERTKFLDSKKQLLIASLTNKFCDPESTYETPDKLVEDASAIVKTLDPLIAPSSGNQFSLRYNKSPRKGSALGETGKGHMLTRQDLEGESKKIEVGTVHDYRIGSYLASKIRNGKESLIRFEYFLRSSNFINLGPISEILYDSNSLAVKAIFRKIPRMFGLGKYSLFYYQTRRLWGKGSSDILQIRLLEIK